ncbi:MAG: hypothetical protein KatS3mg105_1595 [Gemmatales bacterium]|nr:MAG: hypothetical protein KatS3mg105_1595 [Gemmatales bacterium]
MKEHLTPLMSEPQQQAALNLSMKHLRPPSRVPGYESEKLLGRGAYGEVWAAVNRNTGQQVAIKFFSHRGGVDWPLLSREVEKLRFLFTFRHIVQLLEVGWEADPPYYVMEYLSGGSLEDLLRRGTMPVNEAVEMFREILIGITNAHGKGILHCDLKPANILIDNDGKPRLADFGQSPPDARTGARPGNLVLHGAGTGQYPRRTGCALGRLRFGSFALPHGYRGASLPHRPGGGRYPEWRQSGKAP